VTGFPNGSETGMGVGGSSGGVSSMADYLLLSGMFLSIKMT